MVAVDVSAHSTDAPPLCLPLDGPRTPEEPPELLELCLPRTGTLCKDAACLTRRTNRDYKGWGTGWLKAISMKDRSWFGGGESASSKAAGVPTAKDPNRASKPVPSITEGGATPSNVRSDMLPSL